MTSRKGHQLLQLFTALSLIALLFVCFSGLSSLQNHQSHQGDTNTAIACCSSSINHLGDHHFSSPLVEINANIILISISTLFSLVLLLVLSGSFQQDHYRRLIREKYGGYRVFNYLLDFFSSGLLHPRHFGILV